MTVVGLYLHIRCFLTYSLCMTKKPPTMKDRKRDKIKYDRIREQIIKERGSELS